MNYICDADNCRESATLRVVNMGDWLPEYCPTHADEAQEDYRFQVEKECEAAGMHLDQLNITPALEFRLIAAVCRWCNEVTQDRNQYDLCDRCEHRRADVERKALDSWADVIGDCDGCDARNVPVMLIDVGYDDTVANCMSCRAEAGDRAVL